jgi:hypothetical protein
MPKIQDMNAWQQAEMLFQPTYIRLVDNLRKHIENSNWESKFEEVTEPHPGYVVCLYRGDQQVRYNLWTLCYQICFVDYDPDVDKDGTLDVAIDTSLLEPDTGEVDWQQLESKTQMVLTHLFTTLG